jgi:hypothetical protein
MFVIFITQKKAGYRYLTFNIKYCVATGSLNFTSESLKGRDHLKDLEADGTITLISIFEKYFTMWMGPSSSAQDQWRKSPRASRDQQWLAPRSFGRGGTPTGSGMRSAGFINKFSCYITRYNYITDKKLRQRATKYCRWEIMFTARTGYAFLLAAPPAPPIPLSSTSNGYGTHRFARLPRH